MTIAFYYLLEAIFRGDNRYRAELLVHKVSKLFAPETTTNIYAEKALSYFGLSCFLCLTFTILSVYPSLATESSGKNVLCTVPQYYYHVFIAKLQI